MTFLRLVIGACLAFALATAALALSGLRDQPGKADVALVLGNTVNRDGTPSSRLQARLDATLEMYRAGYFPEVITSGGIGVEGFDEAVVMRDYLVAHGIPAEHIIVDSAGLTTYASAQNTAAIARDRHFRSVFVVSQYFHIPRARLALRRFGFDPVYSPHAHYFEWRDLYSTPREMLGYLSYCLRSYPETIAARNPER